MGTYFFFSFLFFTNVKAFIFQLKYILFHFFYPQTCSVIFVSGALPLPYHTPFILAKLFSSTFIHKNIHAPQEQIMICPLVIDPEVSRFLDNHCDIRG